MARENKMLTMLAGLGAGVGLMYFGDPVLGRRRRGILRGKFSHAVNELEDAFRVSTRDLGNRLQGFWAELAAMLKSEEITPEKLNARVRSALGRSLSNPSAIETFVDERGCVVLNGPVRADEVDQLLSAVSSVRGVCSVEQRLDVHGAPSDISGMQGTPSRRAAGSGLASNWSPATRLVAGTAGTLAMMNCLRNPTPLNVVLGTAGFGLFVRAASNLDVGRLTGTAGGRGVDFQKTINIAAPVDEVYDLWCQYPSFPYFMSRVREVRDLGEGRSHWTVSGPMGVPVQWDAVITKDEPNRLLAWRTESGSPVAHAGKVHFQPNPDGTTRVDVRMTYSPPGGAAGHVVASLFGADPKSEMDEDLVRMKSFIETGVKPHDAAMRSCW